MTISVPRGGPLGRSSGRTAARAGRPDRASARPLDRPDLGRLGLGRLGLAGFAFAGFPASGLAGLALAACGLAFAAFGFAGFGFAASVSAFVGAAASAVGRRALRSTRRPAVVALVRPRRTRRSPPMRVRRRRAQAAEHARAGRCFVGLLASSLRSSGSWIDSAERISRLRVFAGYSHCRKRALPALTSKNIAPRLTPSGSRSPALLRVQECRSKRCRTEPCRPSRASPRTGLACL